MLPSIAKPARVMMISSAKSATNLEPQETVVFYPTYGALAPDGVTWRVFICGSVTEPGGLGLGKRIMLRLLKRVMKAEPVELESELFQERIRGFVAASEGGKRVWVKVGQRVHALQKRSTRMGYFSGTVSLTVGEMHELSRDGDLAQNWLRFRVASPWDSHQELVGQAQLLPHRGVSVISDIDDTIKHSQVTCRRSLLRNTFLREFLPIGGMPEVYQQWAQRGAAFHYVSSSPWQLFDPLAQLCEAHRFPTGTFHLRSFRLRDHMLRRLFLNRRPVKGLIIKQLVKTFPQRTFVLVGDSGERDPEIYGAVARKFREQVAGIFIRDLAERPMDFHRCEKAFRKLPKEKWQLFREPAEIAERLPQ